MAIPCFNQGAFLFDCLNSLMAQTEPRWEAVVVDDHSDGDAIERIVASYRDSRISCIRHPSNQGLAASRNTALRATAAPYVLPIDADDFLHPEFLETLLPVLQGPAHDCVFADFQLVGLADDVWRWPLRTIDDMAVTQWIPGPGTLMRRSVWERGGGYCESLRWNEDWDFWIGAVGAGAKAGHLPRALYYYRRHKNSLSVSALTLEDWKTREFIVTRHPQFFADPERMAVFLAGGYAGSGLAHLRSGHYGSCVGLFRKAVTTRPSVALPVCQSLCGLAVHRARSHAATQLRRLPAWRRWRAASRVRANGLPPDGGQETPPVLRYARAGYLSHDWRLVDEIIGLTAARSILEIGCGSGRLMPVYLTRGLDPIWGQDAGGPALDFCRRRFRWQSQIRYVEGPLSQLPGDCVVDLVVATQKSALVTDDGRPGPGLSELGRRTRALFVTDLPTDSPTTPPRSRPLADVPAFARAGFARRRQGTLLTEDGTSQPWALFGTARAE